jgi:hypothetical protein
MLLLRRAIAAFAMTLLAAPAFAGTETGTITGTVAVDTLSIPGIGTSGPNSVVTGTYTYDSSV